MYVQPNLWVKFATLTSGRRTYSVTSLLFAIPFTYSNLVTTQISVGQNQSGIFVDERFNATIIQSNDVNTTNNLYIAIRHVTDYSIELYFKSVAKFDQGSSLTLFGLTSEEYYGTRNLELSLIPTNLTDEDFTKIIDLSNYDIRNLTIFKNEYNLTSGTVYNNFSLYYKANQLAPKITITPKQSYSNVSALILSRYGTLSFNILVNSNSKVSDVSIDIIHNWSTYTPTISISDDTTSAILSLSQYDCGLLFGFTYYSCNFKIEYI